MKCQSISASRIDGDGQTDTPSYWVVANSKTPSSESDRSSNHPQTAGGAAGGAAGDEGELQLQFISAPAAAATK